MGRKAHGHLSQNLCKMLVANWRMLGILCFHRQKEEGETQGPNFKSSGQKCYLHLSRANKTQGESTVPPSFSSNTGMPFQIAHLPLPSCASLTISIFLFVSIDLYLFPQSNKGVITPPPPRKTGGPCRERDRYFLPSWAHVF